MPLEDLPNGFVVPTRDEIRDRYQRDHLLRRPGSPTGEGSDAFIDGSVLADAQLPLYANAVSIARGGDLETMTRVQLQAKCKSLGIAEELPAAGAAGFVLITASAGGVALDSTRTLRDDARNLQFKVSASATYYDGQAVPIIGISTGAQTNLAAGARLKFENPPAGLNTVATVQADAKGDGLTGGRGVETNDDIRDRIRDELAEKSAGGNVAKVRDLVRNAARDLGIAIQDVFVYPCVTGPGHYAYVFLLRPGSPGSSRIPTTAQIAAVRDYLGNGRLPGDDGIFGALVLEEDVTLTVGVRWAQPATGWTDPQPWPIFADAFVVSSATSPTVFSVQTAAATPTAPQAGKTIAFFDNRAKAFVRKKILTATDAGGGVYDLVIDVSNASSDIVFTPTVGDGLCPWSDSLSLLVAPLLSRLDLLGPGEQVSDYFDEGKRQKRHPEAPGEWPFEIRHKDLLDVEQLPQIVDATWLSPTLPYGPSVGVAGVSSNVLSVKALLAFPI